MNLSALLGINLTLIVCSTPISYLAIQLQSNFNDTATLETLYLFGDCIDFSDPGADGWNLLAGNEDNSRFTQYPQFTRDWFSFLLNKFREESASSADYSSLWYALYWAGHRKGIDDMNLILEFDTQRDIQAFYTAMNYVDGGCSLILYQVLAEKGIDIRDKFHGETPTSQSLRVSTLFFSWRDDARLLYPNIDCLIERELSKERAPSLRGWSFDLLRDLFVLDKPESQKIDNFWSDFQPLDEIECNECNHSVRVCDIVDDLGCIIEPWWEGLKYTVKSRECLCSMSSWVQDGRDANEIIHHSCHFENTDSGNNSQLEDSSKISENHQEVSGIQSAENQDTGSKTASDESDDDSFYDSELGLDRSNSLIREVNSPSQHCPVHRLGDTYPFLLWVEYCYKKHGGWRDEYLPSEYYCFLCLALREGWDANYEEFCEHFETLGEHSQAEELECDSDESDSGESD